jgi:hypothetical protein
MIGRERGGTSIVRLEEAITIDPRLAWPVKCSHEEHITLWSTVASDLRKRWSAQR